ncbi:MAG: SPASM domain-containing protein [Planctomycetota bacterium]
MHPNKVDREMENFSLLAGDLAKGASSWDSRPTTLELSFNNLCNLRCRMCAKADREKNALMDKAVARRALAELLPYALHWTPSANSEPLLNDMQEVHDLCREHIVWLLLFTNATILTKERFLAIRERTHRLFISFDSHVKETFELLRTGADYEEVLANIRAVIPLAKEDATEVTFNVVLMRQNLTTLPEYVHFVAGLGADGIHVQELLPNSSYFADLVIDTLPEKLVAERIEAARAAARERKIDLFLDIRPPYQVADVYNRRDWSKAPLASMREQFSTAVATLYPHFCPMANHYVKVNPSGAVFPCCRAPAELEMGNLYTQSFEEIWNGERYRTFRQRMFARDYPESCKSCYILTGNPAFQSLLGRERHGLTAPPASATPLPAAPGSRAPGS